MAGRGRTGSPAASSRWGSIRSSPSGVRWCSRRSSRRRRSRRSARPIASRRWSTPDCRRWRWGRRSRQPRTWWRRYRCASGTPQAKGRAAGRRRSNTMPAGRSSSPASSFGGAASPGAGRTVLSRSWSWCPYRRVLPSESPQFHAAETVLLGEVEFRRRAAAVLIPDVVLDSVDRVGEVRGLGADVPGFVDLVLRGQGDHLPPGQVGGGGPDPVVSEKAHSEKDFVSRDLGDRVFDDSLDPVVGGYRAARAGAPMPVVGHQTDQVRGLADRGVVLGLVAGVVAGVVLLDVNRDIQDLADLVDRLAEFGHEFGEAGAVIGGQVFVVDLDAVEVVRLDQGNDRLDMDTPQCRVLDHG